MITSCFPHRCGFHATKGIENERTSQPAPQGPAPRPPLRAGDRDPRGGLLPRRGNVPQRRRRFRPGRAVHDRPRGPRDLRRSGGARRALRTRRSGLPRRSRVRTAGRRVLPRLNAPSPAQAYNGFSRMYRLPGVIIKVLNPRFRVLMINRSNKPKVRLDRKTMTHPFIVSLPSRNLRVDYGGGHFVPPWLPCPVGEL